MKENRTGIASGGNWIVDRLKIIDTYPEKGMLANIAGESYAIAGAPANVQLGLGLVVLLQGCLQSMGSQESGHSMM